MEFPYETGDWSAIFAEGASRVMFTGWGGIAPGFYTATAIVICVAALVLGNSFEQKQYDKAVN